MIVAKISTDRIVQVLKPAQEVAFDSGLHVLVCDKLTEHKSKVEPYCVPASTVAWEMEIC